MRMYPQTLCPIILLLVFVQTSTTTTISVDSDSSSTRLMLLSLARIEAALSRVDTLDLQSVRSCTHPRITFNFLKYSATYKGKSWGFFLLLSFAFDRIAGDQQRDAWPLTCAL